MEMAQRIAHEFPALFSRAAEIEEQTGDCAHVCKKPGVSRHDIEYGLSISDDFKMIIPFLSVKGRHVSIPLECIDKRAFGRESLAPIGFRRVSASQARPS
jgi:hypothetical protein